MRVRTIFRSDSRGERRGCRADSGKEYKFFGEAIPRVISIDSIKKLVWEATDITLSLFRIMVPILIAVKILKELGMIEILAGWLAPVMQMVGLPGSMGLAWASAMLNTFYAGLIVFASLSADNPLTVAQTTVLYSIMLVAHGLPMELAIARKAGARPVAMGLFRVGCGFLFGLCLHHIYQWGGWLQQPNVLAWVPPSQEPSLVSWAVNQAKTLAMIYVIILALVILLRILARLGITGIITRLLQPVLTVLGIGSSAATITIVGMTLGLAYGGGLIIREANSDRIDKRDIFSALALMGLCHSLIEDTLLTVILGGDMSGVFWGRIVFSMACVFLLVRVISRISDAGFYRYFFMPGAAATEPEQGMPH